MRGLSARNAVTETVANLGSRWFFSAAIAAVAFAVSGGVIWIGLADVNSAAELHQRYVDNGATGFVVSTTYKDGFSSERCEQLNTLDGVDAAGSRGETIQTAVGSGITAHKVTSGYIAAVLPRTAGIVRTVAGARVASSKHLLPGSTLVGVLASEESPGLRIDSVAMPAARDARVDAEILVVSPPLGYVNECVVIAKDGAEVGVGNLLTAWFPGPDTTVSNLHVGVDRAVDPQRLFGARASKVLPLAASAALILALTSFWMVRRSDFALYRLLGVSRSILTFMIGLEAVVILIVPAVSGIGFAFALALVHNTMFSIALTMGLLSAAQLLTALTAVIPIGIVTLLARNPSGLVREGA